MTGEGRMTNTEQRLLIALKALIESTKADETGQVCLSDVEFAVIEANALIWEIEHAN